MSKNPNYIFSYKSFDILIFLYNCIFNEKYVNFDHLYVQINTITKMNNLIITTSIINYKILLLILYLCYLKYL